MKFIEVFLYNSGESCYILKDDIVGFHTADYQDDNKPTHILLKGGHDIKTITKVEEIKKALNIDQTNSPNWG